MQGNLFSKLDRGGQQFSVRPKPFPGGLPQPGYATPRNFARVLTVRVPTVPGGRYPRADSGVPTVACGRYPRADSGRCDQALTRSLKLLLGCVIRLTRLPSSTCEFVAQFVFILEGYELG
jgi:hypothetical protein